MVVEAERAGWRDDPVRFVKEWLGGTPWEKQRRILEALRDHDYVAVRSCNGSGKTYIAAHAVIWWLMCYDDAVVITTAPTERQVSEMLWREIRAIHRDNAELIGGRITTTRLDLAERRFAFGFSTNVEERFQGFHQGHILFVVDEASGVEAKIFDAIEGSMTSRHAKMLLIGNPNSLSGVFYDAFHKERAFWETIHISAFDTPGLQDGGEESDHNESIPDGLMTARWVARAKKRWGEKSPRYQVRVLGEFPKKMTDTLIPLDLIEAAVARDSGHFPDLDIDGEPPIMGLDIARYGNDRSVACVRRGPMVVEMSVFPSADTMATTGFALDFARKHNVARIYVDEVGVGAGVLDRMRELREFEAIGINGGHRSREPKNFLNLRAEFFSHLRDRFQTGDIAINDDPELISELATLNYNFTSKGQMQLEDKQKLKSRGNPSPDKADALMLAFTPQPKNPLMMWII